MNDKTNMSSTVAFSPGDLATPEQLAEELPTLSPRAISTLIQDRHNNGLAGAGAVVRLGKRLLISRVRFARWLAKRAEAEGSRKRR